MRVALITFGCSWTYGVGCHYEPGMPESELIERAWEDSEADVYSFRAILSKKYNLTNINFAVGGSSNQRQFRVAKEYFMSEDFKNLQATHDKVIVLWGITSTARYELYSTKLKAYVTFFFHQPHNQIDWPFHELMLKHCYDHDVIVNEIELEMKYWDEFFKNRGIKNAWFDTFNHHNYKYTDNLLFNDEAERDLLSKLARNEGLVTNDKRYHISIWKTDTDRVSYLVSKKLLNPYTNHPSKECHVKISDMLSPAIEKLIG